MESDDSLDNILSECANEMEMSVGEMKVDFEGRLKKVTESDMKTIEQKQQAAATKRNTKWGMNVFAAWCIESGIPCPDFAKVPASTLADLLRQFYASAVPQVTENRKRCLPQKQAAEYHKNYLKNIRGALNRHLNDIGRVIDIVKDREFKKAKK